LRELQLHDAVVEIEQRQIGAAAEADRRAADLQLGAARCPPPTGGRRWSAAGSPRAAAIVLAGGREAHRCR
jgi:hypothetical protein